MPRTFVRPDQVSGSNDFSDAKTTGHEMIQSGSLRTLDDDLNNLRTILKTVAGEDNWYEDVSAVGGVQRNLKSLHTHLDALMSGSRPQAGALLQGDFQQKAGATFDVDVSGAVTVDSSAGAISLAAAAASNFTTSAGTLTVEGAAGVTVTSTGGTLTMNGTGQTVDVNSALLDVDATGVQIDSTGGISIDSAGGNTNLTAAASLTMAATAGPVDIDADGGTLSLDGSGGINIGTESDVAIDVDSSTFDLDASGAVTVDSTAGISLDAAAASNFTVAGAQLALKADGTDSSIIQQAQSADGTDYAYSLMYPTGNSYLSASVAQYINTPALNIGTEKPMATVDINTTGAITLDSSGGGISLDAGAASNLSTSAGALTLDGAGGINIGTASDVAIDVDSSTFDLDASGAVTIDAAGAISLDQSAGSGNWEVAGGGDLSLSTKHAGNLALINFQEWGGIYVTGSYQVAIDAPRVHMGTLVPITQMTMTGSASGLWATTGWATAQLDADAVDIDASSGALSLDGSAGINIGTAANVAVDMNASTLDIDASSTINLDGSSIALGGAGSTGAITADSTAGISLDAAGASNLTTTSGALTLQGASGASLSASGGDVTVEGTTFSGNDVTIPGNLTVSGNTTTLQTTNTTVKDSIIALGSSSAGIDTNADRGLLLPRTGDVSKAFFWDHSDSKFALVDTWSSGSDAAITVSAYQDLRIKDLTANDISAAGLTASDLTDNRVVFAGTAGILEDSASLTFDGSDLQLANDIGLVLSTDDAEKIESDGTDLTVNSGGDINLTATSDVNVPSGVGMTFGNDGEKIEGDGTDLTVASSNDLNFSVTADFDVDAATMTVDASGAISLDAGAASNLSTSAGALTLDGAGGLNIGTASDVAIDMDSSTLDIDASGALTMTSTTMALDPSSTFDLDAAGAITLDGASFTVGGDSDTGAIAMDSTAGVSLDAAAASNFSTSAGALTLSGSSGLALGGSSIGFHTDGSYDITGGLLLSSGSSDVDSFLSNFSENNESVLGALNYLHSISSDTAVTKQTYVASGSMAADVAIEGVSLQATSWNSDHVNVYLNGVLQRSGSQDIADAYRDSSGNLKFNFALEDGDYIAVTSGSVGASISGGSSSGSPGGSDTQVQFNDGSSFGGDSGLTFNKTTNALTIAGALDVNAAADISGATSLAATGVLTDIRGTLSVDEAAQFDTTLGVTGASTLAAASFSGAIDANSTSDFQGAMNLQAGLTVAGPITASLGISGSLTRLVNGTSYLVAGSNVTITSASNGQVTIASSGGGSSATTLYPIFADESSTTEASFTRISTFAFDPSEFSGTTSWSLETILESTSTVNSASLRVYNFTDSATVTTLNSLTTTGSLVTATLSVPGDLPSSSKIYEVQLAASGSATATCTHVKLRSL